MNIHNPLYRASNGLYVRSWKTRDKNNHINLAINARLHLLVCISLHAQYLLKYGKILSM